MRRSLGLLAGWAAATAAAVGLGWAAVATVTGAVTAPPPLAQAPDADAGPAARVVAPTAEVDAADPTPTSGAERTEAAGPTPPGAPATDPPATQTLELVGGTVAVRDDGTAVRLVFATPRPGFAVDVRDRGPDRIDVRFSSEAHESRLRVEPGQGAAVEERPE